MVETEMSHNDDRFFIQLIRGLPLLPRAHRNFDRGINGSVLEVHVDEPLRVSLDLERAIVSRLPEWVAFDLPSLELGGQRNEQPNVLLPHNAPKVLYPKCQQLFQSDKRTRGKLTLKVSGTGACVAMYRRLLNSAWMWFAFT